ncbi:MAG: polyketide synthase dehydratase domain-containing protein, partial [Acidobacteriota bacterium]|nr:polyketide synthase dehydratase domain-containing protein [Acidobacteriota bacterium]
GSVCLVRSINWGAWAGGMVSPSLVAHFEARGVALLPLGSGARAFAGELSTVRGGAAEVVVTANGAPTFAASAHASKSSTLLVNSRTYPFLDGHRIQNTPVVPVVLVLEWFFRAAAAFHPEIRVSKCADLKVLSGILLPDFEGRGSQADVQCESIGGSPQTLRCALSSQGRLHYSATLSAGALHPEPTPSYLKPVTVNGDANGKHFYPGRLFHGPAFQIIRHLYEMDGHGASALLQSTESMAWNASGPWRTDVAGMDGALQVIRLWTTENLGGPSLPTSIGQFLSFAGEPAAGLIHCVARCRAVGTLRTLADVTLADTDGRPLAELRDVEMHVTAEAD